MRKDLVDRLLRAAQDVVNDADNDGTSQVIVDRETFDDLRAIVKEVSDDAMREGLPVECWCSQCNALRRQEEEPRLKPSPLETCADGAAEWEIDARMAERAAEDGCQCGEATGTRPAFHPLCLYCLNGLEVEDKPRDWIFTFGYDHKDSQGKSLGKKFVRIYGTFDEARGKMVQRFGRAWAFQYGSEKEAEVAKWQLEEYKIDEQAEKENR